MKSNKLKRIVRVLVFILAIAIGTLSVVGGLAGIICYRTGMYSNMSYQDILEQVYGQIQEHYEMTVIDNLDNPYFDDLTNTNLTYRLYEPGRNSDTVDDSDTIYIKGTSGTAHISEAQLSAENGHNFSTGDEFKHYQGPVANLLFRNDIFIGTNSTESIVTTVEKIVFNSMDQLFYYKTYDNEYYPVNTVSIDGSWGETLSGEPGTNSSTLVYHLRTDVNTYVCMNSKYAPLKTENYVNWITATMDGTRLYVPYIEEDSFNPEQSASKSHYYTYTVERDLYAEMGRNSLYVISGESVPSSVRTSNGTYNLVVSSPKIHADRKNNNYIVSSKIASPLDMTKDDLFVQCTTIINTLYPGRNMILCGTLLGIVLFVLMVIASCRLTFAMKPKEAGAEDKPTMLARIPLLIFLIISGGILAFSLCTLRDCFDGWLIWSDNAVDSQLVISLGMVIISFAVSIMFILNICERIRTKTLFRNTVCYRMGIRFQKQLIRLRDILRQHTKWIANFIMEHTSLFLLSVIIWIIITVMEIMTIVATRQDTEIEFYLFAVYKILEALFVFFCVGQFNYITKGSARQAKGNLDAKLDTTKLFGPFKKHAENLNQINNGVQIAVQERLKSERFKTELITNVTHDIKTPLTSIINYVDLLKQEGITPEEHSEYIEVLDRQSARLKKLIEDLIDASKASTGNLAINLETCNLNILLTQTLGEFEEKLLANHLQLIIRNSPKALNTSKLMSGDDTNQATENADIVIQADSRHLWRIFDNLMTNICKYAQPDTRVYIDLETDTTETRIIFRNTSRYQLEGDGEALLERFVRGDSSRNTEGNGLGLSIAKNLAELMKGHLSLSVDGDLFKVTITFPLYMKRPEE